MTDASLPGGAYLQYGALGVLVLVLVGLGMLARYLAPIAREAMAAWVAEIRANTAASTAMTAALAALRDAIQASTKEIIARIDRSDEKAEARTRTVASEIISEVRGSHPGRTSGGGP